MTVALTGTCSECGATALASDSFCPKCGVAFVAQAEQPKTSRARWQWVLLGGVAVLVALGIVGAALRPKSENNDVASYASEVQSLARQYSRDMQSFSTISGQALILDASWKASFNNAAQQLKADGVKVRALKPPPCLALAWQTWVDGTIKIDTAMNLATSALTTLNAPMLLTAADLIRQSNKEIEDAAVLTLGSSCPR